MSRNSKKRHKKTVELRKKIARGWASLLPAGYEVDTSILAGRSVRDTSHSREIEKIRNEYEGNFSIFMEGVRNTNSGALMLHNLVNGLKI